MSSSRITYTIICILFIYMGWSQDIASTTTNTNSYKEAYKLAFDGKHQKANEILKKLAVESPEDLEARYLLAKTYSWEKDYSKARKELNQITSKERSKTKYWIAAIKNELYANENATALGLANKALFYKNTSSEILRLKDIAEKRLQNKKFPQLGWYNTSDKAPKKVNIPKDIDEPKNTETSEKVLGPSKFGINNTYTVFSERLEPILSSNISYKHQTKFGSIIPRLNYSSRSGNSGVQYDIDLYPKFLKRFYAYLNYGYSNSTLFTRHKAGGDVYASLPGAFEFSAGGRYVATATREITSITNSIGHYRGNYYFSFRSFITPRPESLTSFSVNLLTRKYLKDADNYFGISAGVGYSPELRQIFTGDVLLAETLLFIESQRVNLEYQFTNKKNKNIYKARLGVRRQELAFDSGSFFWGITAGLNYQVKL